MNIDKIDSIHILTLVPSMSGNVLTEWAEGDDLEAFGYQDYVYIQSPDEASRFHEMDRLEAERKMEEKIRMFEERLSAKE